MNLPSSNLYAVLLALVLVLGVGVGVGCGETHWVATINTTMPIG